MRSFVKVAGATTALIFAAASSAQAVPALSFIVDGDTFSQNFQFTNQSNAGENLIRFNIDLSTAPPGNLCFDVVGGGPCNTDPNGATPFAALGGTGATTGLLGETVVDGGQELDITFNDFGVGETFSFEIDVDRPTGGNVTVFGNDLIGATAFADFDDGQRVFGIFAAVAGNADASAFTAQGVIQTPAIPVPAALPLMAGALGMFGLIGWRRRARG